MVERLRDEREPAERDIRVPALYGAEERRRKTRCSGEGPDGDSALCAQPADHRADVGSSRWRVTRHSGEHTPAPCVRAIYRSGLQHSAPATSKEVGMSLRRAASLLTVAGIVGALGATASTARAATTANCSFSLKVGTVLPFTGGLADYGGNMDKAVRLAIGLQNTALKQLGLSRKIKVKLVDSQDGQTQASASVEAAKKEVGEHANVIIGEMASGATIPMAQSVTIPNRVVLISPTASAPQITTLADKGYVWRAYPSDTLQGKVLATAAVTNFGKGATINVGARNDAFGTALQQLFIAQWKKLGGKVGVSIAWNPDQPTFDTEAQQLVGGNPAGWVIIDFPETFVKFAPALVRTGKWQASKPRMTGALKTAATLDPIGAPVAGLSGTAASAAGGPAGNAFHALWNKSV